MTILNKLAVIYGRNTALQVCIAVTAAASAFLAFDKKFNNIPILRVTHTKSEYKKQAEIDVKIHGSYPHVAPVVQNFKHGNLECLEAKGYTKRSFTTSGYPGPDEPVLTIYGPRATGSDSYNKFMQDCDTCGVYTEIDGKRAYWKYCLWNH